MTSQTHDLSIEDILEKVRAETKPKEDDAVVKSSAQAKRLDSIPVVHQPDDRDKIPLGKPSYTIEEFAALDDEDFLANAYRVILGREIDGVGRSNYLPALQQGHIGVVRVLSVLTRSVEGRARGVKVRWILPASIIDRLSRLPVIGKFIAPFMRFIVRSTTNQRLSTLSNRHSDMIMGVNSAFTAVRKNQVKMDAQMDLIEREVVSLREELTSKNEAPLKALAEIKAMRREMVAERTAIGQLIDKAKAALPEEKPPR